jgi:hypothetical protein
MAGEKVKIPTRTFKCGVCGGPVTYHALRDVQAAGCSYCGATIDVTNEEYRVLAKVERRMERIKPLLPMGTRGVLRGVQWEVIGFLRRYTSYEGVDYEWSEYLLWNPYEGFRWLSEYNGHFTFIAPCPGVAETDASGHPTASYEGRAYKSFQNARATVRYALGEMTWKVRSGDAVQFHDHVAPPHILSSELEGGEITWSMGEYVEPDEVAKAFSFAPPPREGVHPAQPNPHERPGLGAAWIVSCAAALAAYFLLSASAQQAIVHGESFRFERGAEPAVLTPEFELSGNGNVEVSFNTNLDNAWAFFNCALVPADGGTAYDFGVAVESYHGVEDGESWSEGGPRKTTYLPAVPPGRYLLRIEPEVDPRLPWLDYNVGVRRDVPRWSMLVWALGLVSLFPLWAFFRRSTFEQRRWAESDYASTGSDDDEDDE